MLVFPSYISCGPEQACFTGFLLVIFKEHYNTYSTLCLLSSLAMLHCTQWQFLKKSDHLVMTAMGFSWSQIWGFQINWEQYWHSKEIETVPSSGFSEKIRTNEKCTNLDFSHQFIILLTHISVTKNLHWGNLGGKYAPTYLRTVALLNCSVNFHHNNYTESKQNTILL